MAIKIERNDELRLKGHLLEIREVNDEVLGGRQGYPMAEVGYKKTLQEVLECATVSEMDEIAEYIKSEIKRKNERPTNRKVRRTARRVVSEAGFPASGYLNRA